MTDTTRVDERIDEIIANTAPDPKLPARTSDIGFHEKVGGIETETVAHLIKVADLLSQSGVAVPPHCRGNIGTVFAILLQAREWGLPYMAVLNQSYVTKGKGGVDRIAYMAQLIHTLIETRADLKEGLRDEFIGEGDDMICRTTGWRKGEKEPRIWDSEPLGKIIKDIGFRTLDNGDQVFKGSPLYLSKPKVQMHYVNSRDWGRVHVPWVILGVYEVGEIEEGKALESSEQKPVPRLVANLRAARAAAGGRGFNPDHVAREAANHTIIEGGGNPDAAKQEDMHAQERRSVPDHVVTDHEQRQRDEADNRGDGTQDQGGSGPVHREHHADDSEPAGHQQAAGQAAEGDQAEIFPPDRKPAKPRTK